MSVFRYFFTHKAYLPEDIPGKLFSPLQITTVCCVAVAVVLLAYSLRNMKDKNRKRMLIGIWIFVCIYEVVIVSWSSLTSPNGFDVKGDMSLYICSIFMYVMPFAIWGKRGSVFRRTACSFLCTLNFIGGLVNFVYPANILTHYSCISFAGFHTIIYHAVMVFVALFLLLSRYYDFNNLKDGFLAAIPVYIVSIPAHIVNFTFDCSYMFFRGGFIFDFFIERMPLAVWIIILYLAYALIPFIFYFPFYLIRRAKSRTAVQNEMKTDSEIVEKFNRK